MQRVTASNPKVTVLLEFPDDCAIQVGQEIKCSSDEHGTMVLTVAAIEKNAAEVFSVEKSIPALDHSI